MGEDLKKNLQKVKETELVQRLMAPKNKFWKETINWSLIVGGVVGASSFIPGIPDWLGEAMKYFAGILAGGAIFGKFTKK